MPDASVQRAAENVYKVVVLKCGRRSSDGHPDDQLGSSPVCLAVRLRNV